MAEEMTISEVSKCCFLHSMLDSPIAPLCGEYMLVDTIMAVTKYSNLSTKPSYQLRSHLS